jgi:hypothetical protein
VFIETRILQSPSLSGSELANKFASEFGVNVLQTVFNLRRQGLRFEYHPARYNQALNETRKAAGVEFCRKMLRMRESLQKIFFPDELRVLLRDSKRWI